MNAKKKKARKAAREAAAEEHKTKRMWERLHDGTNAIRKSIGRKPLRKSA